MKTVEDNMKAACLSKYGDRRFFNHSEARMPPILYTFPGSGSTWLRMLLDRATGIYSGSMYGDEKLIDVLPGEIFCSKLVTVIKVHPHHRGFRDNNWFTDLSKGTQKAIPQCYNAGVERFDKAILLIRDPFDSIWSEYQRQNSNNISHVGTIPWVEFIWSNWEMSARHLAQRFVNLLIGLPRWLCVFDILFHEIICIFPICLFFTIYISLKFSINVNEPLTITLTLR